VGHRENNGMFSEIHMDSGWGVGWRNRSGSQGGAKRFRIGRLFVGSFFLVASAFAGPQKLIVLAPELVPASASLGSILIQEENPTFALWERDRYYTNGAAFSCTISQLKPDPFCLTGLYQILTIDLNGQCLGRTCLRPRITTITRSINVT
jgi:hypothetical protein